MRHWRHIGTALLLVALLCSMHLPHVSADAPAIVWTQASCTILRAQPSIFSAQISGVVGGTGMHVVATSADGQWYQVLFLGEVQSWVAAADVATTQPDGKYENPQSCLLPGLPLKVKNPVLTAPGPTALQGIGTITQLTALMASPDKNARVVTQLAPGMSASVVAWVGDTNGDIWYLAHAGGTLGWIWSYALLFDQPDPATHAVNGTPVWSAAAGKGMWLKYYFVPVTDANAIVQAAKAAGITHLYLQVAETNQGFFDANSYDRLVPLAHAAGIKVFAVVYPYLDNIAKDLVLTQQVVDYTAPDGSKADGIAVDLEERTDAPAAYAYGQVLRQMVGPDVPLVVTTYNPWGRPSYPYPEVAASFNVIAPQDYWHNNKTSTFTAQNARDLLTLSVTTIRAQLGGKAFPIEEYGQMYDMFSSDGSPSGTEPSGAEITADMQTAQKLGCIGVTYFEWQTASPAELDVFDAFQWQ